MKKGLRFTPLFLLLALEVLTANALPDLQVTEANHFASGCLNRGQSYNGSGVIKNVGDASASAFRVLVRMYGVDTYFDVTSLSPGEEKTLNVAHLLPADAPCQRYGIRVIVDVDNTVIETSEGEDNAKNGISLYPCECPEANPSSTPTATSTPVTPTPTGVPATETPTATATEVGPSPSPTHSATMSPTPTNTSIPATATPSPTHTSVEPTATATPTTPSCDVCDLMITHVTHEETNDGDILFSVHVENPCGNTVMMQYTQYMCVVLGNVDFFYMDPPIPAGTSIPAGGVYKLESVAPRWLFPDECTELHVCFCSIPCIDAVTHTVCVADPSPTPTNTSVPPTATPTHSATPSSTPTSTATQVPATATPSPTHTSVEPTATETPSLADIVILTAEHAVGSTCLTREVEYTGRVVIKNTGGKPSGNFSTTIIMYGVAETVEGPLNPNEEREILVTRTLPLHSACQLYGIRVIVDTNNTVEEADEENNAKNGVPLYPCGCQDTPTPTPTSIPESCDSGYYVMDVYGSRHRVGNPPVISGGIFFGGNLARDMERAQVDGTEDLVILDAFGASHFVSSMREIPQEFYFPSGRAVDMQMSRDSEGLWVLTDYGRIYKAGSALDEHGGAELITAIDGMLGWDIPTPNLHPDLPPSIVRRASLRAVSLIALDITGNPAAEGYLIFDSQGGHYQIKPDGQLVAPGTYADMPQNHPYRLLDPGVYLFPFFAGLDILRDVELHPSKEGLVVFDGWGGIHPVPVEDPSNPVFYTRNEDPANPGTLITTVGMPYTTAGFDDPSTPSFNESIGVDSGSIHIDFEFSDGCPDTGFWTLDAFGGVFVFGDVRRNPSDISSPFGGSPYFYPHKLAKKLAIFK